MTYTLSIPACLLAVVLIGTAFVPAPQGDRGPLPAITTTM